jgi:AcrR family transcriptional regulator
MNVSIGTQKQLSRQKQRMHNFMIEEIFHAAARVIAEHGIDKLTMDVIAKQMGVSKPAIYYYFKSKNALIYELALYSFNSVAEVLQPIVMDKTLTPRDKLEKIIRTECSALIKDTDVHLVQVQISTWKGATEVIRKTIFKNRMLYLKDVARVISQTDKGKTRNSVVNLQLANLMVLSIEGAVLQHRFTMPAENLAEVLVEFIFKGIL